MKNQMYVITHKCFTKPSIQGYESLLVGANHNSFKDSDYFDNVGDNISDKNKNYCELTGLYWIWKNSSCDIIGLCHYRRYFTKNLFSKKEKYYVTSDDMCKYLQDYDIVLPKMRFYKETTFEALNIAPNVEDMKEIERAIKAICPDYLESFHAYLNSNKCYLYNMFIMRRELLDQYCEWLFKLLFNIEENYRVDNDDPYRSRLFGFLSERLIYVWVLKNINPKKIKELRVVKTDERDSWLIGQDIKNYLRNYAYKIRRLWGTK